MKNFKRVISSLVVIFMLLSLFPLNSFAQEVKNPNAREQIIAALTEKYGAETATAMYESMASMGIIDENGNRLTYKIEMDDKLYTLDQMRDIVKAPDVDLKKEVKVDDKAVDLAFISKLIDFEEYLKFVEDNFLKNNVTVTEDHVKSLTSLENQLNTTGISLVQGATVADPAVVTYSTSNTSENTANITYTLTGGGTDSTVTFSQECLPGLLDVAADSATPTLISLTTSNPTKSVTINLTGAENVRWNGETAICYVHLKDLSGGLFSSGKSSQLVPITKSSNYNFTAYKNIDMLTNSLLTTDARGWEITNGYWQMSGSGGEIKSNGGGRVIAWQDVQLNADDIIRAENGELTASASGGFWGAGKGATLAAFLDVIFLDKNGSPLGDPRGEYKEYPNCTTFQYVYFLGPKYTLPAGTTSIRLRAMSENPKGEAPAMRDFALKVTDNVAPTVKGISSLAKTFKAGEQAPIVVTFSEPIVQDSELTLTMKDAKGKIYLVENSKGGLTNSKVTFMFDIPPQMPATLWPVSISGGAKDTSDHNSLAYNFQNDVAPLPTIFAYNELDSMVGMALKHMDGTALTGAYLPSETKGRLEVNLFQSSDPTIDGSTVGLKQNEWLISNTTPVGGDKFTVNRLYASYDNGKTKTPLYITDATDKLTAEFELPGSAVNKMRLYLAIGPTYTEFRPILEAGYNIDFNQEPLILVKAEDMNINYPVSYPSGKDKVLNLGDDVLVRLTYTYNGDATYKTPADFKWVSSDETIATISATGEITPMAVGKVRFNLVAMNGTGSGTRDVTKASEEFTVGVSLTKPSLAVSKFITTKKGVPVQVMWSTNVIYINQQSSPPKDTTFALELFEGYYTNVAALAGKTPTYTVNTAANANLFTIPGDELTKLSIGTEPAYTVKISTDNPNVTGEKVEALGNIIITSPPANVKIERPASYYILDTANSFNVNWTSMNVNTASGCDFKFEVTKNGDSITTSEDTSGSYNLNFGDVTGKLKDVYTITAKIKNKDDEAYSYDSYVLNVYDATAMKIWVDKQDTSNITIDNEGLILGKTSAEIVALERNISLTNKLSINYGDHSYGLVTDQIEWKSRDAKVASVNYSQGGAYNNIEDYDNSSYMPNTNFILAGLKDGTTTINATHKLARMTDTLGVTVKTLKDKLYLFQAMPLIKTELIYTNGEGIKKTVDSDDKGAVAIYEPKGIKGDIKLKSTDSDSTYMGTIYNASLVSGENDGSKGQLYPINNFVLRKAAVVDMNFKNPDGTPYTGNVTIRAGVYKNGNYCEDTEISDNTGVWQKTITIKPTNGLYRQIFDITRFWSKAAGETSATSINSTDNINYVLQLNFENDAFEPQIMKFSGNLSGADVLRYGESVVNLVSVAPENKNKPFFAAQYLDRYKVSGRLDNIKNVTGNIGLNAQTPKVRIDTQAIWWGAPSENKNVAISILNEKGVVISGQNYKTFKHPFATLLETDHQMIIDQSNIWVDKTGNGKLTVKLFNEDGTLYNSTLAPYSIRNMTGVENVEASPDINEKFKTALKDSIKAGSTSDKKDNFTQAALNFTSNIKFGNDNFSLMLAPTSDPTVFNGLLQLNVGDDVMDMGPAEDEFSLMLDEEEVASAGAAKAGYAKTRELVNSAKDAIDGLGEAGGSSFKYQVGGYFSCKVSYNFEKEKWEIRPIGGGIRAGISYEFSNTGNVSLAGIPLTYEIALGAAVRLDFDAHVLYEPVNVAGIDCTWSTDSKGVTDYLTNLRIKAYIYAFGGLGFDVSIVALKIGVFGQLVLENENKFLNRNYLDKNSPDKTLSGSWLSLSGQVGIKFVAKLLFIKYQKTLASASFSKEWTYRNWDKIGDYWKETTGDMLTAENAAIATRYFAAATGQDMVAISSAPALESRDYLKDFTRVWEKPSGKIRNMSLDATNLAPSTLQSNAYPYASPLLANDGSMFVYLSDNGSGSVWDTTANYAVKEGSSFVDKGRINAGAVSFGDSQLSFANSQNLAISAWARLADKLDKNASDVLTDADIAMMTNNTEIYTSIYKSGLWTTQRLTENSTPDMAPVVATNGNHAMVAWRSVYAGDAENPTDFSGKDNIVYRIFDGTNWSHTKTLYNGISGNVVGMQAAMMTDGTSAIAYTIDTSGKSEANGYEVVYGVLDNTGAITKNVRLTNDNTSDENPQITVAKFGDEERFMIGWYKMIGEKSDIRLATLDNDGSLKEDFVDSLNAMTSGNIIGSNFKFVNTSKDNKDIKNLSVLWVEHNMSLAKDSLKAIKFNKQTVDLTDFTFTSAPIDVATMPNKTVIDSFDAYISDASKDEIKAVILGTETKDQFDTITGTDVDEDGKPITINVPKTESKMFTATETYQNAAQITAVDFNYSEIMSGFMLPIAFAVQNQGKELITSVTMNYGTEHKTFDNLKILPGTSQTLVANYSVPKNIEDISYSGTATFSSTAKAMTGLGTLPLAIADVGIGKINILKEKDGKREFAVALYNSSDYKLNTSGKKVKLAIYDNSAYVAGTEVAPIITISSPDELALIDNGAFTTNLDFDIKAYLTSKGNAEIPDNGVNLYAKAWIVDGSDKTLSEFVGDNNFNTILCDNLVNRNNGNPIKVDVKQSNSNSATTAVLTLQNLAMKAVTSGNVAVNLLDEGGNILRTQYLSNTAEGLVSLGSEGVINKTFTFDTLGADVEAYYFSVTSDSMNSDLQILAASGVGVDFDKNTTTYDKLSTSGLKSTNITAISANPKAKVILKDASNTVLAVATAAIAYSLPLTVGNNTFTVTVEPDGAGAAPKTYKLTVANDAPASGSVTLSTAVQSTRGWWNSSSVPVTLTVNSLTNFTPANMQYKVNDGDWTNKNYTSGPIAVTNITTEGTHVISAKLQDVNSYNLTADSLTVKLDRTAPAFALDKTSATLVGSTLTVSANVADSLSGIYSVVMSTNGTTYAMQKQGDTDTYTANITANSIGAITIVATDMAGNTTQNYTGTRPTGGGVINTSLPISTTVIGSVLDSITGAKVSNVTAIVTTDSNGRTSISMDAAQTVVMRQPDGMTSKLSDLSKVAITTIAGSPVTISADGTIHIQELAKATDNNYNIKYDLGSGQKIAIGTIKIKVDNTGKVTLTISLIDPYGIIKDAATGKAMAGVNVTLYYANTDRNIAAGKTPGKVVALPGIAGFGPNDNKDPQISDGTGAYGFMVFPNTDYYIVATKDGYKPYTSEKISVEQEIVKWDFSMNKINPANPTISLVGPADSTIKLNNAYTEGGATAVDSKGVDLTKQIITLGTVDVSKPGDYTITYKVKDAIGNEAEVTRTVHVINTAKPIITLKGDAEVTVKLNSVYTDLGATATDNKGSDIASKLVVTNNVDSTKAGDYVVTYTVTDSIGNVSEQARRVVHVVAPVVTPVKPVVKPSKPVVVKKPEVKPVKPVVKTAPKVVKSVVLAGATDSISGSVLASKTNGITVTPKNYTIIKANKSVSSVFILGGNKVIDSAVEKQIKSYRIKNIVRISGSNAYETSELIAKYLKVKKGTAVIVASSKAPGTLVKDVISKNTANYPIVLTTASALDKFAKVSLLNIKPSKVYVVGDAKAMSTKQITEITKLLKLKNNNIIGIKTKADIYKIK